MAKKKHPLEITLYMAVRTANGREYLDTTCIGWTPEAVQEANRQVAERHPAIEQEFPLVRVARVRAVEVEP